MSYPTLSALLDDLARLHLLEPEQFDEARRAPAADPPALARDLVQRGWLTPYQVNQLFRGRGVDLLLGSYILRESLGEGGMGQVFLARNWKLGRTVALKLIRKERLSNPDAVRRFEREIRAAAQLDHPHVVHAYDADAVGGTHFFTMEYVQGIDLARLVREQGRLPVAQACEYVRQAALGLQHAFERGLVHRDIKPANLLLTADGAAVKLLDLGLAKVLEGGAAHDQPTSTLTAEGMVMGTYDYLAPEQARDASDVDIRADLYSLGCTLFFLLTGQPVFAGGSSTQKLLRHQTEEAPAIERLRPEVPAGLARIVRRLLAKRPADRYRTPAELAAALAALPGSGDASAAHVPATAPAETPPLAPSPFAQLSGTVEATAPSGPTAPARRSWGRAVGLAGAVPALVVLAGLVMWLSRTPPPADEPPEFVIPRKTQQPTAVELAAAEEKERQQRQAEADKALRPLAEKLVQPGAAFVPLAREVAAFRAKHGGTPAALRAAELLRPLRSPLDELDPAAILPRERLAAGDGDPAKVPAGLVAVLGDSRLKHWNNVDAVAYRPDGKELASSGGGRIAVWNAATGEPRLLLHGTAGTWSGDGTRLVGLANNGIRVWDAATGAGQLDFKGHTAEATRVAFRPGGTEVVSADAKGVVKAWDAATGAERLSWPAHDGAVTALLITRDGKRLATADKDGNVRFWDAQTGTAQQTVQVSNGYTLSLSPDGRRLAGVKPGGPLRLWDAANGAELPVRFQGHLENFFCAAFSPDGARLAVGGTHRFLRVWNASTGEVVADCTGHCSYVFSVSFSADGTRLASGSTDPNVKIWDPTTGKEVVHLPAHAAAVTSVALAADAAQLVTSSDDGTIKFWHAGSARQRLSLALPGVCGIALRPDDTGIAAVVCVPYARSSAARLFDARSGDEVWTRTFAEGSLLGRPAFSPDGTRLALGGRDGSVRVVSAGSGELQLKREGHNAEVNGVAFSPDGRRLASAGNSKDSTVRIWDAQSGAALHVLKGIGHQVHAVTFSPDGRHVAAGGYGGQGRIWDVNRGEERRPFGLRASIYALAYSPDGRTLGAADLEGNLVLVDAAGGQQLREWRLPGWVRALAFAADGRHLITANHNGTLYVLRLGPPAPPKPALAPPDGQALGCCDGHGAGDAAAEELPRGLPRHQPGRHARGPRRRRPARGLGRRQR